MSDDPITETSETSEGVPSKPGFSFGFSKKSTGKQKFVPKVVEEKEEKDYIKDVKGGKIEGSKVVQEKVDLVIPCAGNKIKFPANKKDSSKSADPEKTFSGNTDEDVAARELLEEAQRWQEGRDREDGPGHDPNFVVPLKSDPVDPDNKEFLDADVATRAEASTMDDYDSIPVVGFGMGMLRGMGFKEGLGVGGFKQLAVACIEPVVRPKGLGLGAAKPKQESKTGQKGKGDKEDENLILTKSAFVQIERGSHKNLYGQVDGLDEETARVVVRLALGGQVVSVSENVIRLVGKKEYKEFSKMLNKDSFEKYRDKQKEREEQWDRDRGQRENRSKDREEKKRRSRSRSPEKKHRDSEKSSSKSSKNGSSKKREERTWLRPMLRVRIVDKNYRSGKYFNSKVVVEDVSSNECCVCRTESGTILEDVSNWRCETLIPKSDCSIVMIVRGQNRGQLAEILSRDKRSSRATLQILPDKEDIVKLDYDDICEYVGDTSHL